LTEDAGELRIFWYSSSRLHLESSVPTFASAGTHGEQVRQHPAILSEHEFSDSFYIVMKKK